MLVSLFYTKLNTRSFEKKESKTLTTNIISIVDIHNPSYFGLCLSKLSAQLTLSRSPLSLICLCQGSISSHWLNMAIALYQGNSAMTLINSHWLTLSHTLHVHSDRSSVVEPTAQDRSPFCIFHIMNEILQHSELIDTFLVWTPLSYILGRSSNEM